MKSVLLAILLALVPAIGWAQNNNFLKTAPDTKSEAWWLRTEYQALDAEVRGLPVAKIRRNWCKATEFRKDLFPPDLAASFPETESPFAVDGFFDDSKTKQTALIGVYQSCKGERGAFFLILGRPEGKPPTVRYLVEMPGARQFATVDTVDASTIAVTHCMECDHISKYKWNKTKKRFVLLPPDPDE